MQVNGKPYRTVALRDGERRVLQIIDQRRLPHAFITEELHTVDEVIIAIRDMHVRGAPAIGVTAAYGVYLAALHSVFNHASETVESAAVRLKQARPTAVNLEWAVDKVLQAIAELPTPFEQAKHALEVANQIAEQDVANCIRVGQHGLALLESIWSRKRAGEPLNIMTHCNAGWLACVDWGTATAPIYMAHEQGLPLHVWVSETRPRNQGSQLTAWELHQQGVPHTVIVDSAAAAVMQQGKVDLVIVGSDRTTRCGDVANKIGTYLKALAAESHGIPFYVALPSSTIDWTLRSGSQIPIEERSDTELRSAHGSVHGRTEVVQVMTDLSPIYNPAFDVTPSALVTGLITERGVCDASEAGLLKLYPEHANG